MNETFQDRAAAGRLLASRLDRYRNAPDLLIVGMNRGGMPVAREVARELNAELDVALTSKLTAPSHPELALGAVAEDGTRVLNTDVIDALGLSRAAVERLTSPAMYMLEEDRYRYRSRRPLAAAKHRTVLLIDDGAATGATLEATVLWLLGRGPNTLAVAIPVAAQEARVRLQGLCDEFVSLQVPEGLRSVSSWFHQFDPVSDPEVWDLLADAGMRRGPAHFHPPAAISESVRRPWNPQPAVPGKSGRQ